MPDADSIKKEREIIAITGPLIEQHEVEEAVFEIKNSLGTVLKEIVRTLPKRNNLASQFSLKNASFLER